MRVGGVVLAAGAGSRFGGGKLHAPLAGRPVLQHVLDALAAAGIEEVVIVLGEDARIVEGAIARRHERVVANPDPSAGLSSSLRVGLAALTTLAPDVDVALVALGDQPLVRPEAIRQLLATAARVEQPVVVPRYTADAARNPVVIRRAAWRLAEEAAGDRGLGPVLSEHAELVAVVDVAGENPDVDTPADLDAAEARLASAHAPGRSAQHG